jgi:antitoxin ParD1/3/4
MNITLPDSLKPLLDQKAAQAGFSSIDEYALEILRAEVQPDAEVDDWLRDALADGGDPASVTQEALEKRKQEIDALLVEGLESGTPVPMSRGDWRAIRERVERRLGKPLT